MNEAQLKTKKICTYACCENINHYQMRTLRRHAREKTKQKNTNLIFFETVGWRHVDAAAVVLEQKHDV